MNKVNLKRTIPPLLHILSCVIILFIPFFITPQRDNEDHLFYLTYLVRVGGLLLVFYINYLYLIDNFLFSKKLALYFIVNILIVIGLVSIQNLLNDIIWTGAEFSPKPPIAGQRHIPKPPPHEMRLLGDYIFMVFFVGMSVALKATMRWYKDSIKLETIKATQLEADLRNLRSQLNPHFLFNTLNNIYSLVTIDAPKAQESIHRLSGLLRFVLYENGNKFVPIDKELEFTKNYIDLMMLRISPNIKLDTSIINNGCSHEIASLMFMTLIENAFKHGITSGKDGYINIRIYVDKEKGVLCSVENSVDKMHKNIEVHNSGIGLANLKKRLELLYPKKYQLDIKNTESSFSVLLRLDFEKSKTIEK